MAKLDKKKRGFTLLELMLAVVIFSIVVAGFSVAMITIYKNSRAEFKLTKGMYGNKEVIEEAASKVLDEELDFKEKLEPDKLKEIKDKYGVDIVYEKPFKLFNGVYLSEVDGYTLTRNVLDEPASANPLKYTYFISNDNIKAVTAPEYEFCYLIKDTVDNNGNSLQGGGSDKFEYNYLGNMKSGYNVAAKFKVKDGTGKFLFYENYDWQKSLRPDDRVFEPVLEGKNAGQIPENAIDVAYPVSEEYFESLSYKRKVFDFKTLESNDDFYVRFKIDPVTTTRIDMDPVYSNAVWVIALPILNDLLYHFDVAMCGEYLDKNRAMLVDKIEDTFSAVNPKSKQFYIMRDDKKPIRIGKDEFYGKYIDLEAPMKINSGEKFLKSTDYGDSTHFLVVDLKNVDSSGPIIQAAEHTSNRNENMQIAMRKTRRGKTLFFGNARRGDFAFDMGNFKSEGKQIIVVSVQNRPLRRIYWLYLNSLKPRRVSNASTYKDDAGVAIGALEGAKLYEFLSYKKMMSDKEIEKVYNYLKRKHHIED